MAGTRTSVRACSFAVGLAVLAGCGGDDKASNSGKPPSGTQPTAQKPRATPIDQPRALGFPTGTPREELRSELGPPLPVNEYALNQDERRDCDYYPFAGKTVNYDNVFRFCFKGGKLFSVSTAPSRKAAGPGAGAPSPDEPGKGVRKGK
jgi:hypothetical protein